jgi:hypothetical protein
MNADGEANPGGGTGFWTKGGVSAPYYVRPCRKRFDLYQLSATPPSPLWHTEGHSGAGGKARQ